MVSPVLGEAVVRFCICDHLVGPGERLAVSGSLPQLGGWQPDHAFDLTEVQPNTWQGEIRVRGSGSTACCVSHRSLQCVL